MQYCVCTPIFICLNISTTVLPCLYVGIFTAMLTRLNIHTTLAVLSKYQKQMLEQPTNNIVYTWLCSFVRRFIPYCEDSYHTAHYYEGTKHKMPKANMHSGCQTIHMISSNVLYILQYSSVKIFI